MPARRDNSRCDQPNSISLLFSQSDKSVSTSVILAHALNLYCFVLISYIDKSAMICYTVIRKQLRMNPKQLGKEAKCQEHRLTPRGTL